MQLPQNKFKKALAAGKTQIGLWSSLCSPTAAEVVAHSGFDWILLDMEHGPNEISDIMLQLQIMAAFESAVVVRAPWNDMVMIKRLLDIGARSLLLPYVQNADEAKKAVEYVRYPTAGVRGVAGGARGSNYGRIKDYAHHAHEEICLLVQAETIEAVTQLEEIASVEGVDGVFVGPADLAASMGHLGNPGHEDVQAEIKKAAQTLDKLGVASGILATQNEVADRYLEWGYKFVAVGTDVGMLVAASDKLCKRFKD